jgi:hypothetical protein
MHGHLIDLSRIELLDIYLGDEQKSEILSGVTVWRSDPHLAECGHPQQ